MRSTARLRLLTADLLLIEMDVTFECRRSSARGVRRVLGVTHAKAEAAFAKLFECNWHACALLAAIDAPILCPAGTGCVDLFGQRRADDFEGFDDWPTATLTLFVVTTLDGWSSIMWRVQVRCNPSACVGWNARARQCSTPAHALLTSIRAHSRSA